MAVCAVNCTVDGRSCCWDCSSYRSIASYSSRIAIFAYSLEFDASLTVSPSECCHNVWCGKLEWYGYPIVKNFWKYIKAYSFRQSPRTWQTDRWTDRHRITAEAALPEHRAAKIVRFSWNLVHYSRYWTRWQSHDQKLIFFKFKMMDGRHLENRFWT